MGSSSLGFLLLVVLSVSFSHVVKSADWNILNHKGKKRGEISLKNYCESWRMNVELHNIREFQVVPQECTEHIGKYMKSVQYAVDLERAIDECTVFLSTSCNLKKDWRDAWIFDIDEWGWYFFSFYLYFKIN